MIYKKSLIGVSLMIMSQATLLAADLPPRSPSKAPSPIRQDNVRWTGFYLGVHGGGALGSSWINPFNGIEDKTSTSGALAGGQIGYNYQIRNFVFGAEADFSWTNLSGDTNVAGTTYTNEVDWTSTITGRAGIAYGPWLAYGKGGIAFAHEKSSLTTSLGTEASGTTTQIGWTVGAGVEYALAAQWSARLEYNYLAFDSREIEWAGSLGAGSGQVSSDIHQFKAGVNFRF